MKNVLLSLICIVLYRSSFAQIDIAKINLIAQKADSLQKEQMKEWKIDTTNHRYFSTKAYDRYFDKYFTQIKYERESFTEGNSASLNVSNNETRLNLTLSHKSNNIIFSLGTGVNISDKSGTLFSGDKPTAGTEFSGSISYLPKHLRFLNFRGEGMMLNWKKREDLIDSIHNVHVIRNPNAAPLIVKQLAALEVQEKNYQNAIATEKDVKKKDSLREALISVLDKKKKALQDAKSIDDGSAKAEDFIPGLAKKSEELSIERQLETPGVTFFRFQWFTGGVSYRKDSYSTYDSLLSFAKRIDSKDFDKWTMKLAYNFFWQRTDAWIDYIESKFINSVYFNLNYSLIRTNSFEKLKDQTLSITRVRVQNDTTYEFASQKKVKDISKKTYSDDWLQQVGGTLTTMIGKKQFFGLNLSSQTEITSDKTVWNERLGLLFRFLNSEKDKSKINFELFLALNDVSDEAKTEKSAWKRKEIGVSLNVPFEKVFFR